MPHFVKIPLVQGVEVVCVTINVRASRELMGRHTFNHRDPCNGTRDVLVECALSRRLVPLTDRGVDQSAGMSVQLPGAWSALTRLQHRDLCCSHDSNQMEKFRLRALFVYTDDCWNKRDRALQFRLS
jgi:hypothetical protein